MIDQLPSFMTKRHAWRFYNTIVNEELEVADDLKLFPEAMDDWNRLILESPDYDEDTMPDVVRNKLALVGLTLY